MSVNRITFFRDYYLDTNAQCSNYMQDYTSTYNRLVDFDQDIRNLVDAWESDYEQEAIGIGPQFTLRVEQEGGFVNSMDEVYRDFMIEAAYRDFILEIVDPNNNINWDTSDTSVAQQIHTKLVQFQNIMNHRPLQQ